MHGPLNVKFEWYDVSGYLFNPILRFDKNKNYIVFMKPEDGIEMISRNVVSFLHSRRFMTQKITTSACFLCVHCGQICVLQINTFRLQYNTYIKMLLATWRLIIRYCWYNIFLNGIRVFSQYLIIINIRQNLFYCLWIFAHFLITYLKQSWRQCLSSIAYSGFSEK